MRRSASLRGSAIVISVAVLCLTLGASHVTPALARTDAVTAESVQKWDPPKATRKHLKIDSALLRIADAALRGNAAMAEAARGERVVQRGEKIRVLVEGDGVDTAATRAAISAVRGDVDAEYRGIVRAYVAPGALEGLARHAAVRWIARPALFIADGLVDEGVVASNASAWHSAGWDGRDTKIAVIDGGFIGYANALLAGDLPMQTITQDFGCGGPESDVGVASTHGTAVARIVHQMAPAAQLHLLCVADVVGLGQAKDYAIASGVRIINQSLGWFNVGRGDGSGGAATVDGITASARAAGILWVNSAGNMAQRHWSGSFVSFNGDAAHDFALGDDLNDVVLTAGVEYCATLKWDAWPTTALDYDLYLVRVSDNVVVADSQNFQTGSQPPVEAVCYTSPSTTTYGLGIVKFSATTAPRFDLFSLEANLQYRTTSGSVVEPASSPNVMAVGAICWQTDALQSYSSQGPTIDGRIKPDIVGQDATSSDIYGAASGCAAGFRGTSASSPHVAGAAGLALQANPAFTPAQLQAYIEGRAVHLGPTAGKNNQYGSGKLSLGVAPLPAGASISAAPSRVSAGNNLTVTWSNKLAPTAGDWIGLFLTTSANDYIARRDTTGTVNGSVLLTVPASAPSNTYNVRLFHNAGSTAIATSAPFVVDAATACFGAGYTANPERPQTVGVTVTFTAFAACSNAEYRWWVRPPGGSYGIVQDYGSNTFNWNTTGLPSGEYAIAVWARAIGSTVDLDSANSQPYFLTPGGPTPCTAVDFSGNPASPQSVGTTVSFTATAVCGGGAAQYRWWVRPPGGSYGIVQDYGSNTFNWNTTGLPSGEYAIAVWARADGTSAVLDTANAHDFTLTGGGP